MRLNKLALAVPALAAVTLTLTAPEQAQAVSATSQIQAEIVARAITLQNNQALNFGEILPFSQDGYVQVAANGSFSMNFTQVVDTTNLQASTWSVTGVSLGRFNITLPSDSPAVQLDNGAGDTMLITGFTHNAGAAPQLNASGTGIFGVGARLNVNANQQPGIYTGSFNVTVNYL